MVEEESAKLNVESGLTAEQNIQKIFFDKSTPLNDEFDKLFDSLFENAGAYIELVRLIAKIKEGVDREEIKSLTKLSVAGVRLSKRLKNLCETGFIEEYIPWGKDKGTYYKLIDEFILFYLYWVEGEKNKRFTNDHWINQSQRPSYYAWSGYSFEAICAKHIDQIIRTLNIRSSRSVGSWRFVPKKKTDTGIQIDLIIDRSDNAITVCEIKYTEQPFSIDKQYAEKLNKLMYIFAKKIKANKQIFLAMVSANGLKKTLYSEEMVSGVVTLNDLFKEETY